MWTNKSPFLPEADCVRFWGLWQPKESGSHNVPFQERHVLAGAFVELTWDMEQEAEKCLRFQYLPLLVQGHV